MFDSIRNLVRKIFPAPPPPPAPPGNAPATGAPPVVGVGPDDVPVGGVGAGLIAVYLFLVAGASFSFLYEWWPTLEAGCRHDEAAATTPAPASDETSGEAAAPFQVDSISSTSGTITGGMLVRLRGKGFPKEPTVLFDGVPARIEGVGDMAIDAWTPSHSLGPVNVEVRGGGRSSTLVAAYTYICPDGYEATLLAAALLAGILGASLHAMRSLTWYLGMKTLVRSWALRYFLLPFIGGIIGVAFYLLVQVGLFTPQTGKGNLLILGIAVLVGMFSEQSTEKLRKIAEALLTEAPKGANQAPPVQPATAGAGTADPKSFSLNPEIGSIDGNAPVILTGPGLSAGTIVILDGKQVASRLVGSGLELTLPAHAAGRVDLIVTNPGQAPVTLPKAYLYTPISPASGPKAGKTKVTIKGAGFTGASTVTIGGAQATLLRFVDANTLEVETPAVTQEGIVALKVADGGIVHLDLPEAFKYT